MNNLSLQHNLEELVQQMVSTQEQLDRVDIRAPVEGIVHEMQMVTIGGVVPPGATILDIIPTKEGMVFEVRAEPTTVDQIYIQQPATVRLSAFSSRTTPDINGEIVNISASTVLDEATGASFYKVLVRSPEKELARLGDLEVIPGMPVEAFMQTDERTVLSYLLKPLSQQMSRAFREE